MSTSAWRIADQPTPRHLHVAPAPAWLRERRTWPIRLARWLWLELYEGTGWIRVPVASLESSRRLTRRNTRWLRAAWVDNARQILRAWQANQNARKQALALLPELASASSPRRRKWLTLRIAQLITCHDADFEVSMRGGLKDFGSIKDEALGNITQEAATEA